MRRDVFVYLSGPISPKNGQSVEQNVANALVVYLDCLKRGVPAFLPHLGAIFPSCHAAISYEDWMRYDYAVIDRCSHMLMLRGWECSSGARDELAYFGIGNKPVFYSFEQMLDALEAK